MRIFFAVLLLVATLPFVTGCSTSVAVAQQPGSPLTMEKGTKVSVTYSLGSEGNDKLKAKFLSQGPEWLVVMDGKQYVYLPVKNVLRIDVDG